MTEPDQAPGRAAYAGPVLAIDVGGTSIRAEVQAGDGTVLGAASAPTPRGEPGQLIPERLLDAIAAVGAAARDQAARDQAGETRDVVRCGVVVPGIVDAPTGTVVYSANLGWAKTAVADGLSTRLGIPVVLEHDVLAAGEAELREGAARGVADAFVIVVGTGISAVGQSGGRVIRGGRGQAGELGHVVVRPDGPVCACGKRGCLEVIASAGAIARRYAERSGRQVGGARDVLEASGDDPVAAEVWAEAVAALADAVLIVCDLLAPDTIVLGGGLSAAGERLVTPLRERLAATASIEVLPDVRIARFGARGGLVGAGLVARDIARDPARARLAAQRAAGSGAQARTRPGMQDGGHA